MNAIHFYILPTIPSSQGARHLGGSAFCNFYRPEQALGGIPLGFGIDVEDKLFVQRHVHVHIITNTQVSRSRYGERVLCSEPKIAVWKLDVTNTALRAITVYVNLTQHWVNC